MATYASRPAAQERRASPPAMLAIIVVHVAAIAVVMSAKMDLPEQIKRTITETYNVPLPNDPPPPPPEPVERVEPREMVSRIDYVPPMVPPVDRNGPAVDPPPLPLPPFSGTAGTVVEATPSVIPPRIDPPAPVRTGPRFMTPPSAVRPPYPESKISSEEEATLRLRLAIDERGRVIRVDPVGAADPAFLAAARRHLIARWRYQPATEDGRAVVSTTVITLRFQLDG